MKFGLVSRLTGVGVGLVGLGGFLNVLVEIKNAGRMPVFSQYCAGWDGAILDAHHTCASGTTRLAGLADWILWGRWIKSPGDILIDMGQGLLVFDLAMLLLLVIVAIIRHRK